MFLNLSCEPVTFVERDYAKMASEFTIIFFLKDTKRFQDIIRFFFGDADNKGLC